MERSSLGVRSLLTLSYLKESKVDSRKQEPASGAPPKTTTPRRRLARWFVTGLLVAVFVAGASVALATNFGALGDCGDDSGSSSDWPWTHCTSLANNKWHAARPYSFGNQWTGISSAVQNTISQDYNPTDLVAYWTTTDNYPDVRLWDWYYPLHVGIVAWADCPEDNTGTGGSGTSRWCRGQILRFNALAAGLFDSAGRDFVACHEFGHTVGLRGTSNNDSCMDPDGSNGDVGVLSNEDRGHINSQY